ncbi:hypothetical protein [Streptomyces sp. NPDC058254]|uniref:hypothetical protein n=1 Tax=Streptomyces sp. NPDC058254 TaxID=3346406 RepID=UPI0036E98853
MVEKLAARLREYLKTVDYSITYYYGPQFECVKRRGGKSKWFMDGEPVTEDSARARMAELDRASR